MNKIQKYKKKYCNINSIISLSTVDWHGHSSITIFLNGCPFNCQYCYNSICLHEKKLISIENIKTEILKSKPYVSSVIFLGGEPLSQIDSVLELARFSKKNKLLVGIHTNGYYINEIKRLIKENLIDKYFVDIKAPFVLNKYAHVISLKNKNIYKISKIISNIQNSIKLIDSCSSELELKTTIFPTISGTKSDIYHVTNWIKNNILNTEKTTYVLQNGITNNTLNKNLTSLKSCNIEDINIQGIIAKKIVPNINVFIRSQEFGQYEIK